MGNGKDLNKKVTKKVKTVESEKKGRKGGRKEGTLPKRNLKIWIAFCGTVQMFKKTGVTKSNRRGLFFFFFGSHLHHPIQKDEDSPSC